MKEISTNRYRLCPASMEDLEDTVAMFNHWASQVGGFEKVTQAEIKHKWETPNFDLENDTRLAFTPDGRLVGYYEVWDLHEPHVRLHCWGCVHPEHTGNGLGVRLLEWAEGRARQSLDKAPPEARVVLLAHCLSRDEAAQARIQATGFEFIRHSLRMVIHLDGTPVEPAWPEGITVRTIVLGQDEREMVQAVRDSFRDHWGYVESPFEEEVARWQHRIQTREDFDPTLWFLAMDGPQIAGVSLCYPKTDEDPEMGWVGTLGVRRPWRRRGLALALLHYSFQELYKRGQRKVGLGVDAQSLTGATRLYQKAGMSPNPNWQFSQYEKELRPGVELSTQTAGD